MVASHKSEISQMYGLGRKMPITFICFFIASLSIIGLPPLGGMWSKWYLTLAAAENNAHTFIAVLMISSLLNVAYLLPIVARGFFFEAKDEPERDIDNHKNIDNAGGVGIKGDAVCSKQWNFYGLNEAPLPSVFAIVLTTISCVVLFFCADVIYHFVTPLTTGGV